MLMFVLPIVLIIALVASDQFVKYLAVLYIQPLDSIAVLPGVFHLTFVINRGAAFGILQGSRWFFVVITVVVLALEVYYYITLPKTTGYGFIRAAMVLIAAGAIGNFIDRLLNGSVVDMFEFKLIQFPVFNLADTFVVCGAGLLIITSLVLNILNNRKNVHS